VATQSTREPMAYEHALQPPQDTGILAQPLGRLETEVRHRCHRSLLSPQTAFAHLILAPASPTDEL